MDEHQTLYRKWRPRRFAEVVGQTYAVKTLLNALSSGEVAHAYLFSGPRGTGKTTVARLVAKAVNCLGPQGGEPCNQCEACQRIGRGASLDVVEVDGASNRGIDQVRKLREEVSFVPADVRTKVYIIDEVHMLTHEAFNALLKTLEEPPKRVVFIFATTEPHKLPATVISRCQAFEFTRLPPELIAARLAQVSQAEGIRADKGALAAIAARAGGALRDALVTLEQLAAYAQGDPIRSETLAAVLGLPGEAALRAFLVALLDRDAPAAIGVVGEQVEHGRDLELFLEEALRLSRDWLVGRLADRPPPVEASLEALARLTEHLLTLKRELGRAWDKQIWLEVGALQFIQGTSPAAPARATARAIPVPPQSAPPTQVGAPEERWSELLDAVRAERVAVYAYLVEGRPAWEGETLHVRFSPAHRFHQESLATADVHDYVQGKAREVFGPQVSLRVEPAPGGPEPHRSPPTPAGPSALEEKVKLVEEILDGEVIS